MHAADQLGEHAGIGKVQREVTIADAMELRSVGGRR